MRLRKDLSFTKPAVDVAGDFTSRIAPLFAEADNGRFKSLLMEQALYKLTPEMVAEANAELREMDTVDLSTISADAVNTEVHPQGGDGTKKIRHHHRRHVYLPPYEVEQYGILMQNLQGSSVDWLVEFKPKWLVQSPSAPRDARNCRTCALNAMRRSKADKHQVKGRGDSGFCPLDLLEEDDEDDDDAERNENEKEEGEENNDAPADGDEILKRALSNIWPIQGGIEKFVAVFKQRVQPALRHLLTLQREHGDVGLQDFQHPEGKDFGVAMALRDCSVFLALRRRASSASAEEGAVDLVDVKFADLDLKTTEGGKIQKWAAMEQELLDGGWYYSLDGSDCSLSRRRRRHPRW